MTDTVLAEHTLIQPPPSVLSPPFPREGWVRIKQIVGDPKAMPPIPAFLPVSKSTWWSWVNSGKAPKPVKMSDRVTVWDAQVVRQFAATVNK